MPPGAAWESLTALCWGQEEAPPPPASSGISYSSSGRLPATGDSQRTGETFLPKMSFPFITLKEEKPLYGQLGGL